ncbi:MAG: serine/threonine-protein kinase [bacterium]
MNASEFEPTVVTGHAAPSGVGANMVETLIQTSTAYRMKRLVASGGMGAVYEAEQFGADGFVKSVAVKLLLPELSDDQEFVSMFMGEAKLAGCLVHQNIVQIYQLGKSDKRYFIAMEYIDGIDLEQFMECHAIQGKKVPVEIAVFIASRICRGLEYAHNRRDENGERLEVVHRDISPRNIMITSEGEVKIADFGVAKARRKVAESMQDSVMVGKIPYMSPEQASYKPTDPRSDIFSLGVVFYELLTGVRVFERASESAAIKEITTGPVPDPRTQRAEIPESVAAIVMRCLERKPEARHQTAGDLGYVLESHMYSKGYGPTIVTLAKYMASLYPDRRFYVAPSRGDNLSSSILK